VHRLTFSKSLADHLAEQTGYQVRKVTLQIGRQLAPGEKSSNGLYAICKAKSGWPLRITLFYEAAQLWHYPGVRTIHEVSIT
jgi:hypothetical protein